MNLNAYDNVIEKLDRTKTWVDVRKKNLLSREIVHRPYTCLLKRYDPTTNCTTYFIAMLDSPPVDKKYKSTRRDEYGRIKISLTDIWKDTYLTQLETNSNIVITHVEHEEDGDVYLLDI